MVYRVLFACTGNICRSPTAEAVFRAKVEEAGLSGQIICDSCGMHGYHAGENPDPRSVNIARQKGVDMADLIARRIHPNDFTRFDLILAMDESHLHEIQRLRPANTTAKIALFLEYAGRGRQDVPDPYYSGEDSFRKVFTLISDGAEQLLDTLRSETGIGK